MQDDTWRIRGLCSPAVRELRVWAERQSPEVQTIAARVLAGLWAASNNKESPPQQIVRRLADDVAALEQAKRTDGSSLVGSLPTAVEIIGIRQSSAL